METYQLINDVKVYCLRVPGFPQGIQQAFDELEKAVPAGIERSYYGVSWMENEKVVYNAAVACEKWDGEKFGYKTFIIPRGEYLSETIHNWRAHLQDIGATFMTMVKDPQADYTFPCVEWYKSDDEMMCWVKKK